MITWSIHGPFFNFNSLENSTWILRLSMSYLLIIYYRRLTTCLINNSMNSLFRFFRNHRFGIWEWQKSKAISETLFGIVCMFAFRTCWIKEKISHLTLKNKSLTPVSKCIFIQLYSDHSLFCRSLCFLSSFKISSKVYFKELLSCSRECLINRRFKKSKMSLHSNSYISSMKQDKNLSFINIKVTKAKQNSNKIPKSNKQIDHKV